MREIKFRAWNEVQEKMLNWNEFLNKNIKNTFIAPESTGLILMQYTGLHDKNGKEIFEGDIIKYNDIFKGVVEYSNEYAQYVLNETGQVADEGEPLGDFNIKVFEVIGNIHDNPNLLEKEVD